MLSEWAGRWAMDRISQGHTVAQVATDLGVSCTVMSLVPEYGRPLVEDPRQLAGVSGDG
jgi:hypothetical protein